MSVLSAGSLSGLPEIRAGDDLGALISTAAGDGRLQDGQIVVVAHKAVSKAEGAVVDLATVTPGARAAELAAEQGKDPRAVQVVLDQSAEILRAANGVLISRTHHGFVCANAGIDESNSPADGTIVLLPLDPDGAAAIGSSQTQLVDASFLGENTDAGSTTAGGSLSAARASWSPGG